MFTQIFLGTILITLTIVVEVVFIELAVKFLTKIGDKLHVKSLLRSRIVLLSTATLWILGALSIAIWIWAIAFTLVGAFAELETALYFSMVAFTTLGLGDIILPQDWRILSGFIATNGLVLFGLNTAFLLEVLRRIMEPDEEKSTSVDNTE